MRTSKFICLWIVLVCFLSQPASAQNNLKLKYKRSTLYAGIEVGSKGVKLSLVEVAKNERITDFNIVLDSSINSDFISFTPETFKNTVKGFAGLYRSAMNQYDVASNKIYTVVSSGVKVTAERLDKTNWINKLVDSFRIAINEPQRKVVVITPEEEARLSHLGIVPEDKRFNTFLIDIGSGNTKGGYFPGPGTDHIKLFSLNWGTKSIANTATERMNKEKSLDEYYKQLQRVLAGDANKEVIYAVNISGAYNMSDNIAFSGGAAWAVATLLHPEMLSNPVIPVTYQEVEKFLNGLYTNYDAVKADQLSRKLKGTSEEKAAVKKAAGIVNKVFDQEAMLAGTGLLLKIMRQFEGVYEKKQFYLVKNGQVGWISAYVNESIRQ